MMKRPLSFPLLFLCTLTFGLLRCPAEDRRLQPPKDLDGYFPFAVPEDRSAWETRREAVRRQILISQGLFPLPQKTALNAKVFGKRTMDDYTVEKVILEARPGFFVCGSLFRPLKPAAAKMPGILCPHGHWPNGRFMELTDEAARKEIQGGGERFLCAAKNPLQARCVHLARMGCVVFHYDMIGYADSNQLNHAEPHKFAKQDPARPEGFFGPVAEMRLQSIMGLQTWSSIRALDFITELPDVDASKIGVTGASGGGTQTFLLCAVDDRPAASFPAVMVGTAMQGGCTCENACGLRVGTGNVEFAGLFAPKPMGLTAADDWTKAMPSKGFPELQKLYTMLGKPENVSLTARLEFGHNYNAHSRDAMYAWFAKHLLGQAAAPQEREFAFLKAADLTVWDGTHPNPAAGPEFEAALLAEMTRESESAIKARPELAKQGWESLIGRNLANCGTVKWEVTDKQEKTDWFSIAGTIRNETHGEEIPAHFFYPKNWNGSVRMEFNGNSRKAILSPDGGPSEPVKALLSQGIAVGGAQLLLQGSDDPKNRKVANPRQSAAYTYGYNPPLFIQRVHDVLTILKFLREDTHAAKKITLSADADGLKFVHFAVKVAGDYEHTLETTAPPFDFSAIRDIYHPDFLPGALKYGW